MWYLVGFRPQLRFVLPFSWLKQLEKEEADRRLGPYDSKIQPERVMLMP
jgi:hypothetical protein